MLGKKSIFAKYEEEFLVAICIVMSLVALISSIYGPRFWILMSGGLAVVSVYLCSVLYLVLTLSRLKVFSLVAAGTFLCAISSHFLFSYFGPSIVIAFLGSLAIFLGVIRELRSKLNIVLHELDIALTAIASISILIVGAGAIIENWFDHDSLLGIIFLFREGLILLCSFVMFVFVSLKEKSKRGESRSESRGVGVFPISKRKIFTIEILPIIGLNVFGLLLCASYVYFNRNLYFRAIPDFGLIWVLFVFQIVQTFFTFRSTTQKNEFGAKVISDGDKKLLEKMSGERNAYTFAVKTFIYSMDHDPLSSISQKFPASLMQIREEEIKKLLIRISKGRIIDQTTVGTKLHGAFDPEAGACLSQEALVTILLTYLDIGALVNRRIKGLTGILHILDPELAKNMQLGEIERAQKDAHWIFYLDYDWIDQHVVSSPDGASLSSNYEILPGAIKDSILALQNEGLLVGNILWLSESAGLKILEEIPNLGSIIEKRVVPVFRTDRSIFLYFIRFEHLSSRIQGLYDIESRRKMLLDLDPSHESIRLIETLSRRIPLLTGSKEVMHLVNTITSFRWNGFKEKDLAIVLLTKVWNEVNLTSSKNFSELESLNQLITKGILDIGYPSQYLHLAQIRKNSLRSLAVLCNVALDVGHEQFVEAWSVLAGGLWGRLKGDDSLQLLRLVRVALSYRKVRAHFIVRNRIMDIVCFVLGRSSVVKNEDISRAIFEVILTLGHFEMEPDLLIVWVDRIQWLVNQGNREVLLEDDEWDHLLELISRVGVFHGRNLSFLKARIDSIRNSTKVRGGLSS
jgi:hypothetical protein